METAVENFISFLKNYKMRGRVKPEEDLEILTLIYFFKTPEDEMIKNRMVCDEFDKLSMYLNLSFLSKRDKMLVLFYVCHKNYKLMSFEEGQKVILDENFQKEGAFVTITKDEFNHMVESQNLENFIDTPDMLLSHRERLQKKELLQRISELQNKSNDFYENTKRIIEFLLDDYKEEEIKPIIQSLLKLNVDPKLCALIGDLLKNDVRKKMRKPKVERKVIVSKNTTGVRYKPLEKVEVYRPKNVLNLYLKDGLQERILNEEELKTVFTLLTEIYGAQEGANRYHEIVKYNYELLEQKLTKLRIGSITAEEENVFIEASEVLKLGNEIHPYYLEILKKSFSEIHNILVIMNSIQPDCEDYLEYQSMIKDEIRKMKEALDMISISSGIQRVREK